MDHIINNLAKFIYSDGINVSSFFFISHLFIHENKYEVYTWQFVQLSKTIIKRQWEREREGEREGERERERFRETEPVKEYGYLPF